MNYQPMQRMTLAWLALGLICTALPAYALDNPRNINFAGQTVPAVTAPPSAATFTSADGSMEVNPLRTGSGLNFPPVVTYGVSNSNLAGQDTYITVTPAPNAIPYRLDVRDQRASSWQAIKADCLNPSTQAIEPCDLLNDLTLFPRTNYPIGSAPYTQTPAVETALNNGWLWISTPPGFGTQNIQSPGLYIDLPPTVRKIYFRTQNTIANQDSIYGTVYVADAPTITKTFAPANVKPGEQSTLTITLKGPGFGNGSGGTAGPVPGARLTDALPEPLILVNASTTCTGGTLTATPGSNILSLTDTTIPNAGCTITAQVQWPSTADGYQSCLRTPRIRNTITPPMQFSTAVGQMDSPATADLNCTYVTPTPVPTLGIGTLLLSSISVLLLGLRRRQSKP